MSGPVCRYLVSHPYRTASPPACALPLLPACCPPLARLSNLTFLTSGCPLCMWGVQASSAACGEPNAARTLLAPSSYP